ncbi:metallopeptidase TldD-related protein [Solwaraspora sp. WMMD406]|uniref:TldD/PmbA family protein n=1 Tax=Solwaraspora sp. WMMD406 TaxID=3016095 RepID=UPI002417CA52|nr:metallopeptidase TldD-related protein [Solwaraspora sp. WMMD406]MDG4767781.1 metallopeptidase TldD-related protein [Solwaraspora sp. WMMD406]
MTAQARAGTAQAAAGTVRAAAETELAGRVVELVRRAAGAAVEAEAFVDHRALALTRFANSFIHQNVADATSTVWLRLHVDGRTAIGSTTITDADGLVDLVERTLTAARLCPPDPGWPGLTSPSALLIGDGWDEATAQAGPAQRAALVRDFVAAAEGEECAGYCRTAHRSAGFANSAGQQAGGRAAEAAMDGVVRAGGVDGVARLAAARLVDVDGTVLGSRAAVKARAGRHPVDLAPGRYPVVLEPTAVVDLLQMLARNGFAGKAHYERRSFVELGAAQFDSAITLVDDPLSGCGMPFDAEGTPTAPTVLVDSGVTVAVTHDRRTAAQAGAVSTGHAAPGNVSWGPVAQHLRLLPGDQIPPGEQPPAGEQPPPGDAVRPGPGGEVPGPAADVDSAALVASMKRGLLVTDLWYTRVLDPRSLVVTGLTRNGVWLVEEGEIVAALRNLRFTQSYPAALAPGAVSGIGGRAARLPDAWDNTSWQAPALRLASWQITGGATG